MILVGVLGQFGRDMFGVSAGFHFSARPSQVGPYLDLKRAFNSLHLQAHFLSLCQMVGHEFQREGPSI
jgi:hypothetical protein